MSRFNNDYIIRSKSKSNRSRYRQPPVHSHDAHQQIETDQSGKNHGSMSISRSLQPSVNDAIRGQFRSRTSISRSIRHPRKHSIRPYTKLTRFSSLCIFIDLTSSHAGSFHIITLSDNLSIKHCGREISHHQP